jgi:hypothetical protein
MNTHKLGQRKNCNLPGVVVDLPVLGEKDIDDVKNFAAKHDMDYIFASFVQTADDVLLIRQVGRRVLGGVIAQQSLNSGTSLWSKRWWFLAPEPSLITSDLEDLDHLLPVKLDWSRQRGTDMPICTTGRCVVVPAL